MDKLYSYFEGYSDARNKLYPSTRMANNQEYLRGYSLGSKVEEPLVKPQDNENFFKEALESLLEKQLPLQFALPSYSTTSMVDQDYLVLQDFCATYAKPKWATGLSIIEAAEFIVTSAIENGNI
jgi:hypothetical protein